MKSLLENIKESEGFRGVVYKCTEGFDTIGYGTRLPLVEEEAALVLEFRLKVGTANKDTLGFDTIGYGIELPLVKEEAALVLEYRLKAKIKELETKEPFVNKLPLEKQEILAEMCYQMGVVAVLKFKKMWAALREFDYETAGVQMLDSTWAVQTPNRAKKLSQMMRG